MGRSFLGGVIWGAATSLVVAGTVSVLVGAPPEPVVGVTPPVTVEVTEARDDVVVDAGADPDLAVEAGATGVARPEADSIEAAAEAGADTPTLPETGEAEKLAGPGETREGAEIARVAADDAPLQPTAQMPLPIAPEDEAKLLISTDPAQPPAPEVPIETGAFSENGPEITETAPQLPETSVESTVTKDTPGVAEAPQVAALPETGGPAQPRITEQEDSIALPAQDDELSREGRPSIGRPAVSLLQRSETDPAESEEAVAPAPVPSGPPMEVFAAKYDVTGDKPLMSIVLIDDGAPLGGGEAGLAALGSFDHPVSFAVDATLPDAWKRMRAYRDAGFEVLALIDLPQDAQPPAAKAALDAALARVPEAVGVIEGTRTGIQGNRAAADRMIEELLQSGHGFVLQAQGLNTVQKQAARAGVPSAVVFRDFDGAGQTPVAMRRFLDQAAFRAGQEGRLVMLGRLRPDTISALLLWGLQERVNRVDLVPISAVLNAGSVGG